MTNKRCQSGQSSCSCNSWVARHLHLILICLSSNPDRCLHPIETGSGDSWLGCFFGLGSWIGQLNDFPPWANRWVTFCLVLLVCSPKGLYVPSFTLFSSCETTQVHQFTDSTSEYGFPLTWITHLGFAYLEMSADVRQWSHRMFSSPPPQRSCVHVSRCISSCVLGFKIKWEKLLMESKKKFLWGYFPWSNVLRVVIIRRVPDVEFVETS